jgi:hypothetical protein
MHKVTTCSISLGEYGVIPISPQGENKTEGKLDES